MSTPPTTMKIPAPLHDRLLRGAKKTGVKKAALLRLCVDVGLPKIEQKFDELRGRGAVGETGVGLAMTEEQLGELRFLYKSAVTDFFPELDSLDGQAFVAGVEAKLAKGGLLRDQAARTKRFLSVYAQLF